MNCYSVGNMSAIVVFVSVGRFLLEIVLYVGVRLDCVMLFVSMPLRVVVLYWCYIQCHTGHCITYITYGF